jgi:hypothetical protein
MLRRRHRDAGVTAGADDLNEIAELLFRIISWVCDQVTSVTSSSEIKST